MAAECAGKTSYKRGKRTKHTIMVIPVTWEHWHDVFVTLNMSPNTADPAQECGCTFNILGRGKESQRLSFKTLENQASKQRMGKKYTAYQLPELPPCWEARMVPHQCPIVVALIS